MSQAQIEFVRWVKQTRPDVYRAALTRVARKSRLGGLGDDLTSDISFDPGNVTVSDSTAAAIDAAATSTDSTGQWSDVINSIANAITTVAPAIVQSDAQLKTIQINAQRAAANQHPVTTSALFSGKGLAGSGVMVAGLGLLAAAFLLLGKTRSSTNRRA
jgi:hypothetical protein